MSYLREEPLDETNFPVFAAIKNEFGFIPNFYRAQTLAPDLIEPQIKFVESILMREGALARQQKEYIFLVCSAANLSTYCVTAHCEMIRMLGVDGPEPEQIAMDHNSANLPMKVKALLNFAAKLNQHQDKIGQQDVDALRKFGFGDEHILEAVLTVGMAKFANFVSLGLGTVPDFDSSRILLGSDAPASAVETL